MSYKCIRTSKSGIDTPDHYILVRANEIFLRFAGKHPKYNVMTPTADEDNGAYRVCHYKKDLIKTVWRVCFEFPHVGPIEPIEKKDFYGRGYLHLFNITVEEEDEELMSFMNRFFEIYDNSHDTEAMRLVYHHFCNDEFGEDLYLGDGIWLQSNGELRE